MLMANKTIHAEHKMSILEGKIAIVTGASSGLGEATAVALTQEGAKTVLAARRGDRLRAIEKRINASGGTALAIEADVTDGSQLQRLIETVHAQFGRVDILINNAGVMLNAPASSATTDNWRRMIEVNVLALMNATHAVLPIMKAGGGGHIVNISSVAALNSNPGASVYSASKAAVSVFSDSIRKEHSRDNIRVTTISPGAIATELPDHIADAEWKARFHEWMKNMTPLQAEDVAAAIIFALTRPPYMCIGEMVIRPTLQER
jgi:NADP-dependent 3-hydroxy acid dehydrogenase YdfG